MAHKRWWREMLREGEYLPAGIHEAFLSRTQQAFDLSYRARFDHEFAYPRKVGQFLWLFRQGPPPCRSRTP